MIGHLASWLLRLIGTCAEPRQMQLHLQSVPRFKHKEISAMTLACRVIDAGGHWFRRLPITDALPVIHQPAMIAAQGVKI